ncbi:MAG: signal peptidase I [Nitrospirota bacterium]
MKNLSHHNKQETEKQEIFTSKGFQLEKLQLFEEILSGGSSLRIRVTGKSMFPFLRGGEILTIKKVPSFSLRKGDLIFFKNIYGYPLLHRIIKIRESYDKTFIFFTKGDALGSIDEPVEQNKVLGKVCKIEKTYPDTLIKNMDMGSHFWRNINLSIALAHRLYGNLSRIKIFAYRMLISNLFK